MKIREFTVSHDYGIDETVLVQNDNQRYHFIRSCVSERSIILNYKSTNDMPGEIVGKMSLHRCLIYNIHTIFLLRLRESVEFV